MAKKEDVINVIYKVDENQKGYNEVRNYDGSFGKVQLLRTLIGLYNDVVLNHKYSVEHIISTQDLIYLGSVIVRLLEKGETKNAN
jgi:putative Mn2+ efflux pump MntP